MNPGYLGKLRYQWPVTIFVAVMYTAGLLGLFSEVSYPLFIQLVPFHLMVSLALLLYFHTEWNVSFIMFLIITYITGYGVEVLGVHTGIPFGTYSYGQGLGFAVWDVPLVIGVNWVLLVYCSGIVAAHFRSTWIRVFIGALLMTMLDWLIEPVAIKLDFWSWASENVPVQNYIGWFGTSLLLHTAFVYLRFRKINAIASYVWVIQFAFFLVGLLLIRLF